VKRTFMMLAASAAAALSLVPAVDAAEVSNQAQILGVVQSAGETATVRARYTCEDGFHLWVSAKQVADRSRDAILEEEGSSRHAAGYLQSHPSPATFTCDGRWHTGTFTIDKREWGKGRLEPGHAWVQFCLVGESTFISESRWAIVR
jgi:hypothetical protein